MQDNIYPQREDHGEMALVGFDVEGYVVFRCETCAREVGLYVGDNPNAAPIKFINPGNFFASHHASLAEDGDLSIRIDGPEISARQDIPEPDPDYVQ